MDLSVILIFGRFPFHNMKKIILYLSDSCVARLNKYAQHLEWCMKPECYIYLLVVSFL
jgi:hypothetical protein